MPVHFFQTSSFGNVRSEIEQHLFSSIIEIEKDMGLALKSVGQFSESIEHLMDTLEQMYQTPGSKDTLGEKSFPIREGRYRVYYKVSLRSNQDFDITFLDIDDNKQSNLDRFPIHRIITFEDEGS